MSIGIGLVKRSTERRDPMRLSIDIEHRTGEAERRRDVTRLSIDIKHMGHEGETDRGAAARLED